MRGRVTKRGSSWTYVVDIGLTPDGKRKQKSKAGFETKKAAQAALTEVLATVRQGTYTEPTRLTVGSYLTDRWQPAIRATIRPSTFASYQMHCRKYLVPILGNQPLQGLTAPAINTMYADLLQPLDGSQGIGPASVHRVHATLHRALRDAVRWQLIARNPAGSADPPRAPRPQMSVWTSVELRQFFNSAAKHPWYPLWVFIAMTGVRRGEALGLRWADIDFDRSRAAIRQTVIPLAHQIAFSEPKTDKGRRSIALDHTTVAVLRHHRRRQLEDRFLVGPDYQDRDLVFARADGRPLHPEYVSRTFARLTRQAGLRPLRLHDLRHTNASLALAAGVPTRVVSDRLGHSAMAVTTDIYQHVIPDLDEAAAAKMADLVFGGDVIPTTASGELREHFVSIGPPAGSPVNSPGKQIPRSTPVGEGGLEPPHPFGHRNLNPARLPIPPLARVLVRRG